MLPLLALPFLISLLASLVATPIVAAVARRAGFEVQPRPDRWHQRPTALMGGVAIFIACIIGLLATQVISSAGWVAQSTSLAERRIAGILGAAFIMFLLGVADDIWQFRPATKLVVQIIAAAVLVSLGVVFPLTAWVSLNIIFTMFWVIGVTNALNLLDNMDGVAVGVSGIAASFLALTFALQGHWWLAATCATLAGATFGFLPYNFNPASIFMGDSGSLMIGALLAGLCAAFPQAASGSLLSVLFVPGLIVIIPIADAMLVTVTRTMAGRSIAVGGRDHTSHRLVAMGLSEKKVALVLYAFAIAGGIIALMLQRSELGYSVSIGALFLIGLFTFAAYLSKLHSYPANEVAGNSRMTVLVSNLMYKGRALELLLDVVLFALAYYIAYVLRWDGTPPPSQVIIFDQTLAVVVACHITAFALLAVYRGVWTQLGITDLHRLAKALGLATILTAGALLMLFRNGEMSRSVLVINAICATFLTIGVRASFRSLDTIRRQGSRDGQTALIYGAGQLGELVVRELWANPAHRLHPIGFVDDDPKKHGWLVHGLPVIGGLDAVAHQPHVSAIVIGTGHISQQQLSQLQATATSADIRLLRFDLAIRQFDGSTTAIAPATSAITAGPN